MLLSSGGDPNLWTINAMSNANKKNLFYQALAKKADEHGNTKYDDIKLATLELIRMHTKANDSFETKKDIYFRALKVKDFLI